MKKNLLLVLSLCLLLSTSFIFSGCNNDVVNEEFNVEELEGTYQDSYSGRAGMVITYEEGQLLAYVHWADSAFMDTEWHMSLDMVDNKLVYHDSVYDFVNYDENGQSTVTNQYVDKEGYFTIKDNKIYWDGAEQENCKECVFEKVGTVDYYDENGNINEDEALDKSI